MTNDLASTRSPQRWSGDDTFTLRAGGAGGFGLVEAALARKLASVATRPERHAVTVALRPDDANYYTQALVDRECGAWVEAVSNQFVADGHHLGDDHHRLLGAFGFDPPDDVVPNHFVVLDQPTDWRRVAALLIRPLETVYGATSYTELTVEITEVGRP